MRKRALPRASDLQADPVEHYTRLAEEFGHSRRGHYRAADDGKPVSGGRLMTQPLSLFILSLLALILVGTAHLWQRGMFDGLFPSNGATVDPASKRWLMNGGAARVAEKRVADVDDAEAVEPEPEFTPVDDGATSTS